MLWSLFVRGLIKCEVNNFDHIYLELIKTEKLAPVVVEKDKFLFEKGEEDKFVHYIIQGEVLVMNDGVVMWTAHPSELLGISSLFSEGNEYCFSAKVSEKCKVYQIPTRVFLNKIREDAQFSRFIMEMLCGRISTTNARAKGFLDSSSRNRLINVLLDKAKSTKSNNIKYTIDDLALMVGVSSRLVRNILAEFEQKQILKIEKKALKILDLKGLEIVSGF